MYRKILRKMIDFLYVPVANDLGSACLENMVGDNRFSGHACYSIAWAAHV